MLLDGVDVIEQRQRRMIPKSSSSRWQSANTHAIASELCIQAQTFSVSVVVVVVYLVLLLSLGFYQYCSYQNVDAAKASPSRHH